MKINMSSSMNNNYLADKYTKHAQSKMKKGEIPYVNFPFQIENITPGHKYLSWSFIDHDSNPVVQFSWIHWLVANFEIDENLVVTIPEKLPASQQSYVGGTNSYAGPLAQIKDLEIIHNYGGPRPPDKDHNYTLVIYSHEHPLKLKQGFFYNELLTELKGQATTVIEKSVLARV